MPHSFDEIIAGGEAWLEEAKQLAMQESLTLDFKSTSEGDGALFTTEGKLTKNGRRVIGKALSAFSNSAGGVVVIGADCRRDDEGVDCIQGLQPLSSYAAAISSLNSAVGDLLQPKSDGVRVDGFATRSESGAGYVVIEVPRSERRPHMCQASHQYFKRSGTGSYVMEHFDVEDALRRVEAPLLTIQFQMAPAGMSMRDSLGLKFADLQIWLALRNEGNAIAKSVAIQIKDQWNFSLINGRDENRYSSFDGLTTIEPPANFTVHPGASRFLLAVSYRVERGVDGTLVMQGEPLTSGLFILEYVLMAENMRPKIGTIIVDSAHLSEPLVL